MYLALLLNLVFSLIIGNVYAQEVTKIDDTTYEKKATITVNLDQKKSECNAIESQATALLARLAECKIEVSTVKDSQIGKPVDVPDPEPIAIPVDPTEVNP